MIIYKVTNKIDGKSYIGQTTKTLEQRKREHKGNAKRGVGFYFYNAIRKYSWKNFKWKVIEKCDSKEELNEMEKYYIAKYGTYCLDEIGGYNLTLGGKGNCGYVQSEEHKKKISDAHKGKKHTEESKKKISEAKTGKTRTMC